MQALARHELSTGHGGQDCANLLVVGLDAEVFRYAVVMASVDFAPGTLCVGHQCYTRAVVELARHHASG